MVAHIPLAMVLSVTALFWTGLYIGDPGFAAITGNPEPTFAIDGWFSMETMRRIHFIAGVILTFSFIFRFAGALWNRGDRLLPKFRQKRYWYGLKENNIALFNDSSKTLNIIGFVIP